METSGTPPKTGAKPVAVTALESCGPVRYIVGMSAIATRPAPNSPTGPAEAGGMTAVRLGQLKPLTWAYAAIPLVFLPVTNSGGESVFLLPKVIVLCLVLCPLALFASRSAGVPWKRVAIPAALVTWMLLVTVAAHGLSARMLLGAASRLDGPIPHVALLGALLGGVVLARRGLSDQLLRALAISGGIVAVVTVLQHIRLLPNFAEPRASINIADMPGSTIGNRGYNSCLLAALVVVALHQCAGMHHRSRVLWSTAAALISFAVGLCWTRGASIALLAGCLTIVFLSRKRLIVLASSLVCVAALALGVFASSSSSSNDANGSAHTFSTTDSGRKPLYAASVWGMLHRPLTGFGADGVVQAMAAAPPSKVLEWAGVTGTATSSNNTQVDRLVLGTSTEVPYTNITTKVHNELLDYGVSYGVPALALAAATIISALWFCRRNPTLFAAIIAFSVAMMTWPQIMRTAPVFWGLLGLAFGSELQTKARPVTPV
jgi:O-Antigen ligase